MKLYEVKLMVDRQQEDGNVKKKTERYVVEALDCIEAQSRVIEEQEGFLCPGGEMEIVAVSLTMLQDVYGQESDVYYKAKVAIITIDERTAKEKETNTLYLINADDFDEAKRILQTEIDKWAVDAVIKDISETKYLELYK